MSLGRLDCRQTTFEVIVTENDFRIGRWKVNRKDFPELCRILDNKFNIGLNKKDTQPTEVKQASDLDWIR
jgi:hypothetical protein